VTRTSKIAPARLLALRILPAALATLVICAALPAMAAPKAHPFPAPALDEHNTGASSETAVLAGGCFWGVQGVFQHVKGVTNAVSGYAGGGARTAHYETVSDGGTGHAESVRIAFDPQKISYGQILQVFFAVAHDPTELNRQGPDVGSQYRSVIFPSSAAQEKVAKSYIAQLDAAHVFKRPIVTRIEMDKSFYPAEAYHQNYLARHPYNPYIVFNDQPKLEHLKYLFPALYRRDPVLVAVSQ
jgi:peptide-methionine (S)-S-oxide reductase